MNPQHGLTSARAEELIKQYGTNEIVAKKKSGLVKFLRAMTAPASLMLIAASALSFFIGRAFDGYFIIFLLGLNVVVSLWHEHKTNKALEALREKLRVHARVLRDGKWISIESPFLVPGDYVECSVGSLISADMKIEEATNLQINEAVLTGESLPKEKKPGDTAYSGSVVTTGVMRGEVTATGNKAYFGRIATSTGAEKRRSSMEKDILSISRFLIIASLIAIGILVLVFFFEKQPIADILLLALSLLIAGVPISLPTVMTLIMSLGAVSLAEKNALVRRLASLEDFANVTLLLTDKTGTLTESKITVEKVFTYGHLNEDSMMRLAGSAASSNETSLIDNAIAQRAKDAMSAGKAEVLSYVPADSVRKRTTTLLSLEGKKYLVSMGTPPIVAGFAKIASSKSGDYEKGIEETAQAGSRAIAVAIKENPSGIDDEHSMELSGLLVLSDEIRSDAAETIAFLKNEGVNTIMVTGDIRQTASHVAGTLGMNGKTVRSADVDFKTLSPKELSDISVFAEVMPDDKLSIIESAQKSSVVAMAGDGVNDLPAVRRADVGMAVANAVDALKGIADIVFLASGISVMETALTEARKIFFRLYNYSVYRISESFRLIVTALLLGIIIQGFPLTPVQIILLAFLNDVPIITLAFDRVKRHDRPADLKPKQRFIFGTSYGIVGVMNSMFMYFFMANVMHAPLSIIQTVFFLKLTVSGHMLIYVAHTRDRWWRFLPAPSVITATILTQIFATGMAVFGFLVPQISIGLAIFVWIWAFFWMQVTDLVKFIDIKAKKALATSQ